MVAPFKRPRGVHEPPPPAQAQSGTTIAASGADTSELTSTSLTNVSDEAQRAMLNAMPHLTQPLKLPLRFRNPIDRTEDVDWTFRKVFLKSEYKGRQREIMQAALRGSDILVIAPTGMGKSLCFQVPAVAETHGLTLVVTPLLSLMQDQIAALKRLEVPCAMLSSKTEREEQIEILNDMQSGHPKNRLLYITPERLASPTFRKRLHVLYKQNELNRLVVDEAHCISEWGHDFRPQYAELGHFRADFAKTPITALTASATPKVQEDIVSELALDTDLLFKAVHPFNRVNLYYEVRYFSEREQPPSFRADDILAYILKASARSPNAETTVFSGIIYCRAKKTCDELAVFLRSKGVNAAPFHRGLKDSEADRVQNEWLNADERKQNGKVWISCVVATIAFGMGIDKSNCRYVIHYDVPKSFEGYYQETGRAGRDGHTARCIMYYSAEDKARISNLVAKSHSSRVRRNEQGYGLMPSQRAPQSIEALLSYAENVRLCRHISICRYFGEKVTEVDAETYCNRLCDVCRDPAKTRRKRDDGLVSLDFAATQAAVDESARVSPDDFYADGRDPDEVMDAEREGVEQDEHEVSPPPPPMRKCREGFRTAAVQLERDNGKNDEEKQQPREPSSSPPAGTIVGLDQEPTEHEVEVKEQSNEDQRSEEKRFEPDEGQMDVDNESDHRSSPALPSLLSRDPSPEIVFAKGQSSPVQIVPPCPALGSERSSVVDEEEDLPTPIGHVKAKAPVARAPLVGRRIVVGTSAQALGNRQLVPAVSQGASGLMSKLPYVKGVTKPTRFTTPFVDPARQSNYKPSLDLARPGETASLVDEDPLTKFDVVPQIYEKKLPVPLRREAVVHFDKHLQQALFSKFGQRSSASEEVVWKKLGAKKASLEQRREIVLRASISIESDLFWMSLTADGYRRYLGPRSRAIDALISRGEDTLARASGDRLLDEVLDALTRGVGAVMPRHRGKKARVESEEEEGRKS